MNFDFTNYTFSGLLSILAALYGVGYPLIIQSIERIYTQYDSTLLSKRFTHEQTYRWFQGLLIANLIAAVTAPFVLRTNDWNQTIITIQAVLLIWLIGQTFLLFRLMISYSNGEALLKHIDGEKIDKNNVLDILDLAAYADMKHNRMFFYTCMQDVYKYCEKQRKDWNNADENGNMLPVLYNGTTTEIFCKLQSFINADDGHHYLYRYGEIVTWIYCEGSDSRISLESHKLVWSLVRETIAEGNRAWFMQYWQYADSYYNMKYHLQNDRNLEWDNKMYIVRHTMVGALLIKYMRYEWLNEILFYTHSLPEFYGLIPSTFSEIAQMMSYVDEVCETKRFIQQGFFFDKSLYSVNEENFFFSEAMRYLALLIIRLWTVKDRNHQYYCNILDVPGTPRYLPYIERQRQIIPIIKKHVATWYSSNALKEIPRLNLPDIKDVLDLLDSYDKSCEQSYQNLENHPMVNQKKFETLKKSLTQQVIRFEDPYPRFFTIGQDLTTVDIITNEVESNVTLELKYYSDILNTDTRSMEEVFMTGFNKQIMYEYINAIESKKVAQYLKVPRKQLTKTLKQFGYSDDYVIVASDDIPEIGEVKVQLHWGVYPHFIYVMKRSETPEVRFGASLQKDMKLLRDNYPVCSNVDEMIACTGKTFDLQLGITMTVAMQKNYHGSVKIYIDDDYRVQDVEVSLKKTLKDLIG